MHAQIQSMQHLKIPQIFKFQSKSVMKKLYLMAAMTLAATCATAQVDNITEVQGDWSVVPAQFNPEGKGYVESVTYEGDYYNPISATFDVYDENMNKVKSFKVDDAEYLVSLTLRPYDHGCYLTKKVFNDDDKYEYLLARETGFDIMQDDGTLVQSVKIDDIEEMDGGDIDVINLGGMIYLVINVYDNNYNQTSYFYRVNKNTTGVNSAQAPLQLVKVMPRVAGPGESITVELDGAGTAERNVTVTNSAGQTVWHKTVPAGQTSVNVSASRLGKGVNVVTVSGADGKESCKVIVK